MITSVELAAAFLGSFGRYDQRLLDGGPCQRRSQVAWTILRQIDMVIAMGLSFIGNEMADFLDEGLLLFLLAALIVNILRSMTRKEREREDARGRSNPVANAAKMYVLSVFVALGYLLYFEDNGFLWDVFCAAFWPGCFPMKASL